LDGWGISPAWGGNTFSTARVNNFNKLWREYPHAILKASGAAVGLPRHDVGNSEVGHLHIGSGRVIAQDLSRVNESIEDGSLSQNPVILQAIAHARKNNSKLHLMGLVSDGGVHSHISHLHYLLKICKDQGLKDVFVHVFTDGRDSDPMSALSYLEQLSQTMRTLGVGRLASLSGRYYAMDRDNRWDRTALTYKMLTQGEGLTATSAMNAVSKSYSVGASDEFIKPTSVVEDGKQVGRIEANDSLIFFNFRSDRARQLTQAFAAPEFNRFLRGPKIQNLFFASMLPYDVTYQGQVASIFKEINVKNCLAEVISSAGLKQLHIAETEKYAHITYFLNGTREKPFPGESRMLTPSPRVRTYDLVPEMSALTITQKTIENLSKNDFIVINFANPDMVAHTGIQEATVQALEFVDNCVGKIANAILEKDGVFILTADHGNAEEMLNPRTGDVATEHTKNPVPFVIVSREHGYPLRKTGEFMLANIAPTILEVMDLVIPPEMTEISLIEHDNSNINKPESQNETNPDF
jgi:2,3-bisphosphoglycerate-independent phosphoglycerate mutase